MANLPIHSYYLSSWQKLLHGSVCPYIVHRSIHRPVCPVGLTQSQYFVRHSQGSTTMCTTIFFSNNSYSKNRSENIFGSANSCSSILLSWHGTRYRLGRTGSRSDCTYFLTRLIEILSHVSEIQSHLSEIQSHLCEILKIQKFSIESMWIQ